MKNTNEGSSTLSKSWATILGTLTLLISPKHMTKTLCFMGGQAIWWCIAGMAFLSQGEAGFAWATFNLLFLGLTVLLAPLTLALSAAIATRAIKLVADAASEIEDEDQAEESLDATTEETEVTKTSGRKQRVVADVPQEVVEAELLHDSDPNEQD